MVAPWQPMQPLPVVFTLCCPCVVTHSTAGYFWASTHHCPPTALHLLDAPISLASSAWIQCWSLSHPPDYGAPISNHVFPIFLFEFCKAAPHPHGPHSASSPQKPAPSLCLHIFLASMTAAWPWKMDRGSEGQHWHGASIHSF